MTLSTGAPELNNGQLTGFDVSKGSVTIEGLGLDATKQTYFDIISRTAEINANIHANDLSVITGNNKVSYPSNQVTEKSSTPSSQPALAIDSSSIGGMYAGRISLVATEDGVGVNLGNLVSNVGDIVLTADGKVQLASAQSAKNIDISSSQEVALTSQQVAQEQLKISADNLVLNQTTVTAGDWVELTVNESVMAQDSQLFSGIKNNNQTNAASALNIKAAQLTLQESEMVSKGSLSSQIASLELDSKSTVAARDITLTNVEVIDNDGEINASAALEVDAEPLILAGSGTMTADSVLIEASSAHLDSQIIANTLSVKVLSTLDIGQEANLQSTGTTTLNAQALNQNGQLTSNGIITLDASTLNHEGEANAQQIVVSSESLEQRGQLIAEEDIFITANEATLSGQTQAKQTLQVTGETINVRGTLEATQLDVISTSSVNIDSTAQMSAIDQLSIDTRDLLNKGRSHSGGTLTIDANTLEQQGTLTSVGELNIDTTSLDIQGDIETQGNLNITASAVTNNAQAMAGQDLTLSAQSLSNSGTLTASGDTSVLLTSHLTHGSSGTISGQNVTLSAEGVDNSGTLQALASLNLTVSSLVNQGELIALGDLIALVSNDIYNQGLISAGNNANLYSNTLHNTSDIVAGQDLLIAQNAAKQKSARVTNEGRTHSGGRLTINANTLEQKGSMASVGDLNIDATSIDIQGDIGTQGDLTLSASSVINQAQVIAGQDLTLSSHGLSNHGTLTASGDVSVLLTNDFTHGLSGTISGHNVSLSAAQLNNSGTLQALNSLSLTVDALVNKGGLVALGDLTTTVSNEINNQSLIYAGNNANLYSNTLHNTSDIVVGNDLLIAKNGAKQKSASVTNSSGTIESLGGNIGIYTETLTNKRTTLDVESTTTEDKRAQYSGVYDTVGTEHEPDVIEHEYCTDGGNEQSSGSHCRTSYSIALEDQSFTVTAYREGSQLKSASAASRIVAQGDIIIGAGTVLNRASQIAGDNVTIAAGTLTNQGYLFDEYTTYYDYTLGRDWTIRHLPFTRIAERRVKTGSSGQLNSSITAGNNLTLNVANKVNNATIKANTTAIEPTGSAPELKANATAIEPTGSTSELKATSSASVTGPTITFVDRNDIAFPDYIFPTAPNGLFILSPDPKGKYLIETNPLLTNMGNFLGSDYFMSRVGFNPEADVKFLGDAFYDTRIISQAIFEQTGQQYLNTSVGSQLDQMQQLMDAAASQKVSLNLTSGIALSSAQVANLTQDILWYEEIEVNGQTVLAPKLYLAQATIDNLTSGAQIAGSNVSIDVGDLANSGQLSADSSLSVNSTNSITNMGGTIASGGDLSLTAEKDIINVSGDIQGHDVSLEATNGRIINETRVTTTKASLGSNRGTFTDVGKTAAIISTGNLALKAGNNIENQAADIKAHGDASLKAGQDIIVSAKEETHGYDVNARGWREEESETSQIGATVTAGGNLTMNADQDIAVTASQVTSSENLSLAAGNDITVQSALNKQSDHTYRSKYTEINRSEQHQGSMLEGKNVSLQAQNDITLSGSTVSAEQTANLNAKGDVNILAVNDSEYHFDKTVSKKSFGLSKTTINETYQEQVKGSVITAGNDISIKAQHLDSAVTAGGDSNINVIGSSLNAGGEVSLSADGDVTLAAQTYKEFERHESIKKGFGGLSGSNKGSIDDATLLNSSYLINSGNTAIQAGNDIGVIASEVSSGKEVNFNAVNNVLVAAGEVLKQSQEWDEKTSFLSGGHLFEMEKKREGQQSSTAQSSVIQSGGSLSVNGGSVTVIGSELQADKHIDLTADTGDVSLLAAKEKTHSFSSEEKLSVSLGDGFNGVSVDDGQVKISLGDATYDKVKQQSDALSHKGSVIAAGDNLSVDAESSILVEGATLVADSNQDQTGDLTLTAKENVTIKEAVDTLSEQREEIHGKAEASLVVQHQAVEVAKAAQAVQQSTKKLKQAEQDYKQYKKGLDSLESTLSTLEQEYADKKPGVTFDDIEELNDLISEVKNDEAWYVAGVALAAEDVASKTTLLVQQTAAAAQSTGTYGFNAGLHLDIEASQTDSSSLATTSVGSTLSGQNIKINAGNHTGNSLNIQGSELAANDALSLAANEVNITASQDTYSSKSETQSGKIGASMTVYGASSGINLDASFDRNQSTSSSKTHNNSQLSADTISIATAQDTNIQGATVDAGESLTLDVGGDLNVASVQDRHSSSHKGQGMSGGLSLAGGSDAGQLTGGSSGINASNGRTSSKETVVTSLTSNGSLDINVGGNTDIKGATIAALDEKGKDSGQLNLTTDSFTYADLSNTRYSQDQSLGLNTRVGVNNGELDSTNNSTSLQYKNTSGYDKSKTLATIGQGNLTIRDSENTDNLSSLNRDTEHTEKDLFTVDRKQGDIDVTVDHRLLTEDGREAIANDVTTIKEKVGDIAFDLGAKDLSKALYNVDDPKIAEALKGNAESTLDRMIEEGVDPALAKQLLTDPDLYKVASDIMHAYDQKVEETNVADNTVSTNKPHVPGEPLEIVITKGRHLNAPEKVLDGLDSAQKYVNTLPTEQAEAAMIAVSLLTGGVVKTAIDMAKDTVVDTAFGDFLEEVKHEAGKEIVAKVDGVSVLKHEQNLEREQEVGEGFSTKFQNGAEFGLSVIGIGASLGAGKKIANSNSKYGGDDVKLTTNEGTHATSSDVVQELDVGSFKDLKSREVVGDSLEHDHIPSAASLIKAEEKKLGRKLNPKERKFIYDNATTVERKDTSHAQSPTFRGRNTSSKIDEDSSNLAKAACRDCDSLKQTEMEAGKSSEQVDKAIDAIHDRNINELNIYTKEELEIEKKLSSD